MHKLYVSACLSDLNGYMEVLLVSYGGLGGTVTDSRILMLMFLYVIIYGILSGFWENIYSLSSENSLYVDMRIAPIINNVFNMIFEDIGQDSRMQKAKEFIHLNYDKKITIDDMAKNAYISKYHFPDYSRKARANHLISIYVCIESKRQKDLLITTPLSVNEIAIRSACMQHCP